MSNKTVSVIIPAYNAEKTIKQNLLAIAQQTFKPLEVIVVDDGSTDQTPAYVQAFQEVRYIHQENAGPAKARNTGAAAAAGDILFFTDSDCIPDKDWLKYALESFDEAGMGVVCGSYDIANPESSLARAIQAEIRFRHLHLMPQRPKAFGSYNFGVKKNVFHAAGGFDESYAHASGEDNDLSYKITKLGHQIIFQPEALVAHVHPTRLGRYLKEQFRHGFWRAKMYFDHPEFLKGDGYTFWKDAAEVPIVWSLCFCFAASFFISFFIFLTGIMSAVLGLLQYLFVRRLPLTRRDRFFFIFVLFLRAIVRALGLSTGIPVFLGKKLMKKR